MFDYSAAYFPFNWEAPLTPFSYSDEEKKQRFIEERIIDFAEHIVRRGLDSSLSKEDEDLVTLLYEHIENNIHHFSEEKAYDQI